MLSRKQLFSGLYIFCQCGCKTLMTIINKQCRVRRFLNYHQNHGKFHSKWKGGRNLVNEYIRVRALDHIKADCNGYYLEHRVIYEDYYKCCILPWVVIHHINGIKTDNRIENLEPMPRTSHISYHHKKDTSNRICVTCHKNYTTQDWFVNGDGYDCFNCYHKKWKKKKLDRITAYQLTT